MRLSIDDDAPFCAKHSFVLRQLRILLVNSCATTRATEVAILIREGHQVMSIASIHEAREKVAIERPDVLFINLNSSENELVSMTRGFQQQFTNMRILMAFSSVDDYRRIDAFECGADNCLLKPYVPEELIAILKICPSV